MSGTSVTLAPARIWACIANVPGVDGSSDCATHPPLPSGLNVTDVPGRFGCVTESSWSVSASAGTGVSVPNAVTFAR